MQQHNSIVFPRLPWYHTTEAMIRDNKPPERGIRYHCPECVVVRINESSILPLLEIYRASVNLSH